MTNRSEGIKQAIHLHVINVCVRVRGPCTRAQKIVHMRNVLGAIHLHVSVRDPYTVCEITRY